MERIAGAAVKTNRGTGVVISVPIPGRHPDVRDFIIWTLGLDRWVFIRDKQGFVTNTGRFVDRKEGLTIATAAGQIIHKHPSYNELYSEDMW